MLNWSASVMRWWNVCLWHHLAKGIINYLVKISSFHSYIRITPLWVLKNVFIYVMIYQVKTYCGIYPSYDIHSCDIWRLYIRQYFFIKQHLPTYCAVSGHVKAFSVIHVIMHILMCVLACINIGHCGILKQQTPIRTPVLWFCVDY